MIHLDVTKTTGARHRSGLTRVTSRLLAELGAHAAPSRWPSAANTRRPGPPDWWLTAELFSEEERPGITAFLESGTLHTAAIFHDAIPLKHPHITWPQSVARHPAYMKLLARFDRVWAVSAASRDDLIGFWRWQGVAHAPAVDVLPLGADLTGQPRAARPVEAVSRATAPLLLCVGIIEPRKNPIFVLEVCEDLWRQGLEFELHFAGRVNRHFGVPLLDRIKHAARSQPRLRYHAAPGDAELQRLLASAHATVFPTIAEGCGLPLLESLWAGVPVLASDLPPLRENAAAGGCRLVPPNDRAAWCLALRQLLVDGSAYAQLTTEARSRPLPTWRATAQLLLAALG